MALERMRFLYQGGNDKRGTPVFYLIVARIDLSQIDLNNMSPLVSFIFRTMDSVVSNGAYSLVVDMSWARLTVDSKRHIFRQMRALRSSLSRAYTKHIQQVWIVHPTAFTRSLLSLLKPLVSPKSNRKVKNVYNWKELLKDIAPDKIALPESSRSYITQAYRVTKINNKGRRQERLIKFAPDALLNIDPRSKEFRGEKRLDEIERIVWKRTASGCELHLTFVAPDAAAERAATVPRRGSGSGADGEQPASDTRARTSTGSSTGSTTSTLRSARRNKFLVFKKNVEDLRTRIYATDCATADQIMEDLFTVCARRSRADLKLPPLAYRFALRNRLRVWTCFAHTRILAVSSKSTRAARSKSARFA